VLRSELRYELGGSSFRAVVAAFVDGGLLETHYDLDQAGSANRLATPWRVRPGAALLVGFAPRL
jgi:hypothetical protein